MTNVNVTLARLTDDDREAFITENQWAFKHGALMEFGERDDHVDDDGEIISRETVERSIDDPNNEAYRILLDGERVGGLVIRINKKTNYNHLELLFVNPEVHSRGVGQSAWRAVEALHPETEVWETCTPYFEKRNIHFYVNRCGFQIVEFFNKYNVDKSCPRDELPDEGPDEMFRFVKVMKKDV